MRSKNLAKNLTEKQSTLLLNPATGLSCNNSSISSGHDVLSASQLDKVTTPENYEDPTGLFGLRQLPLDNPTFVSAVRTLTYPTSKTDVKNLQSGEITDALKEPRV